MPARRRATFSLMHVRRLTAWAFGVQFCDARGDKLNVLRVDEQLIIFELSALCRISTSR